MPTKRTPLRRAGKARITPDVLALWRLLHEIGGKGSDDDWEPDGRRREFLDALRDLHRALGLKPWEESPYDASTAEPPGYMQHNPLALEGWRKAREWRRQLMEVSRAG